MLISEKLKNLPTRPGVYLFKNSRKQVIYVGKAKILRNRVRSYFQKHRPHEPKTQALVNKIADLEFIITDSEIEALILEANLIKKHKPRYNINLRDDKSFPYIRITAEDFPQVFATRRVIRDGSSYFGPYTNVKEMRYALNTLKKLFTIRSCKYDLSRETIRKKKVQLCLDYYIKKCQGPCQGLQTAEDYQNMITRVKRFLRGSTADLLKDLREDMMSHSDREEFEDAARVRDKIQALEQYRNSQKVVLEDFRDRDLLAFAREDDDACAVIFKVREGKITGRVHFYLSGVEHRSEEDICEQFFQQYYNSTDQIPAEILIPVALTEQLVLEKWLTEKGKHAVHLVVPKVGTKKKLLAMCVKNARYLLEELKLQKMKAGDYIPHVLKSMQRDLRLEKPPRRIECFDISNIQGTDPVASMVCFVNGRAKKSEYRKFAIRGKSTPDDFAMMREVITRRYQRLLDENRPFPDLIVVDGGKGQLSSAVEILRNLGVADQPIIGLAKRLEEIFYPGHSDAQILPKTSSSLRILQQIRDEAHRFAITFHRQKRSKRTLTSQLDAIEGIGPKRRQKLLKLFGSIRALRERTAAEIAEQAGLSLELAERIVAHLKSSQ